MTLKRMAVLLSMNGEWGCYERIEREWVMGMGIELDLHDLAKHVERFNSPAAERLTSLAHAVTPGGDMTVWSEVHAFHAINPATIVAPLRNEPLLSVPLGRLELTRNLLVLAPIGLTWLGLMIAGASYQAAIAADPALIERPFLLLWEEGFQGRAPFTLSNLAFVDTVLIGAVIVLTGLIHHRLNVAQAHREKEAYELEQRLGQAVWRASMLLAEHRAHASPVARFQPVAEGLLAALRAERQRLAQVATEREAVTKDLGKVASDLRGGAGDFARVAGEIRVSVDMLQHASSSLDARLLELISQQNQLGQELRAVATSVDGQHQLYRTAASSLHTSAQLMTDATDRSTGATAGVTSAVTQLRTELGGVMSQLAAERSAYQSASSAATRAAGVLDKTLTETMRVAQQFERGALQMEQLVASLSTVPATFDRSVREQAAASGAIASTTTLIATTFQGTEQRFLQTEKRFLQSAIALQTAVETFERLNSQNGAQHGAARQPPVPPVP